MLENIIGKIFIYLIHNPILPSLITSSISSLYKNILPPLPKYQLNYLIKHHPFIITKEFYYKKTRIIINLSIYKHIFIIFTQNNFFRSYTTVCTFHKINIHIIPNDILIWQLTDMNFEIQGILLYSLFEILLANQSILFFTHKKNQLIFYILFTLFIQKTI